MKFYGTFESIVGGVVFTTNSDSWNLFEYLWRWFLIKIPVIMILLMVIFLIYCINQKFIKNKIKNKIILQNPLLTFYFLQLILTPVLAIIANSSSYNALRHWSFIYPPLIVFSAFVIDNLLLNSKSKVLIKFLNLL